VTLWFCVPVHRSTPLRPDVTEFRSARWWTPQEVLELPAARLDPHHRRFVAKVTA